MRVAWIVLLSVALGGCFGPAASKVVDPEVSDVRPAFDPAAHLAALSLPALPDAEATLTDLAAFVDAAPRRYDNMFEHDTARDLLEDHYLAAGLNVTRHVFVGAAQNPAGEAVEGQNIVATIPGRDPSRTMMVGGHYDSAVSGWGGAYDDGLGTFIALGLARAAVAYEWEHTMVFAAWDQEEAGLVGSGAYVQEMLEDNSTDLSIYVNFDMTGISWPARFGGVQDIPIDAWFGGEGQDPFIDWWMAARDHLGYPVEATTTDIDLGAGSSDHGSFRAAGLPAMWLRGALIGSYPGYHNADTVETMIVDVGGDRADLVAAIDANLQLMFHFMLIVDGAAAHG